MDCVDRVLYDFDISKYDNLPEATRRAFVNIFDPSSDDACLVMRHLVGVCHWDNEMVSNDGIFNSQELALRGVIHGVKKQLNMKEIELETIDE